MSNLSIGNMKLTDGRIIRLSLVAFFGLIALVYFLQSGDIFSSSSNSKFETPQMAIIPTIAAFEPDVDDVIIFPGESVLRTLDAGGIHNWTFEGSAETLVDISLLPSAETDPNFDPVIELYAPSGGLLFKTDDLGANQPELMRGIMLPEAGEYTIWITDETFEHGSTYALTYTPYNIKATHPQRVGVGETMRGKLGLNEYQMWVFSGAEGSEVSITLLPIREHDEAFRPIAELYSPDGQLITRLDSAERVNVMRNISMPSSGNYTLWVMDDGSDQAGEYALSVQQMGGKAQINERER